MNMAVYLFTLNLRVCFDLTFLLFFDFRQNVRFGPDATLHPRTFLHLFGAFTLLPLHKDLAFGGILYIYIRFYSL